jgi:chromosome segregation protein
LKITGFKIAGFKSFADPVEVNIAPGMTGIVGPNGCGKSNVIESFRWSMGEISAKSMRADSMDDVIFGGTDLRAPKAACEVITIIDNSDRTAPVEFNDADILEVSRRLDRGEGSSYKINGKPVKAKDVRVLFKDAGIGASSSALVSQGKVAAIISAKPLDRKQVLEEAAGVTGLASRRHEADLRLRATEQNLEQAENLEKGLSDQQSSLRRQARQAKFRQEVDDLVRSAEATAFLVRWRNASVKLVAANGEHERVEVVIKDLMTAAIHRQVELEGLAARSAPTLKLRTDAEMAHALALAKIDNLRKEGEAARRQFAAAERNIARTISDLAKSKQEIGDSAEEFLRLKDEQTVIKDDKEYDIVLLEEATADLLDVQQALDEVTAKLNESAGKLAAVKVEWLAAERAISDLQRRQEAVLQKRSANQQRISSARSELVSLPATDEELVRLADLLQRLSAEHTQAFTEKEAANVSMSEISAVLTAARTKLSVTKSELSLLISSRQKTASIAEAVTVAEGYDLAFAAAFAGEMDATISGGGDRSWNIQDVRQGSPRPVKPLAQHVIAPPELRAALGAVGVVENEKDALALVESLLPGQMLVTTSGKRFRWDGFRSTVDDYQAEEMRRERRIRELQVEVEETEKVFEHAGENFVKAQELAKRCSASEQQVGAEADLTRRALADARAKQSEIETKRLSLQTLIETLEEGSESFEIDIIGLEEEMARLNEQRAGLSSIHAVEAEVFALKGNQKIVADQYEARRRHLEKVRRDAEVRVERLASIEQKIVDFDRRIVQAREHIAELEVRQVEYQAEQASLQEVIERLPEDEADASDHLEELSVQLVDAARAAQECEALVEASKAAAKVAEEELGSRREDRARIVAEIKAAQEASQELVRVIEESLHISPDKLAVVAGVEGDVELPDVATCTGRVEGLKKRRDAIGAVNPLAEAQLKEVEDKLGKANAAREELRTAVKRLRDQIAAFDRERRERLIEAFAAIDGHFRDLFTRVFGGGRAFLKLSGSDDPLEAGLEIFASPPGKNLQSMTLLSGGEQAMTALALIFAAFLIRPAPVCVLDEVDAALDDANIDRLTRLVEELAGEQTRFLVITHRSLTMSKCDRLYGVTMAEKGVSKLLTLDMEQAAAYVQARQGEV